MSYTPTVWETGDVITAQLLNKMENAIHAILSDYDPTNWADSDIITAEKLNKLENAIAYINFAYVKTTWKKDDIITASLLNNMENGIETASIDKTWEEMDWNDIIVATRTGKYTSFNLGDMKELNLGTEGIVHMQIVGIDEDDLADGSGKAPLTFISKELLNTGHRMNPVRTPSSAPYDEGTGAIGGWEKCEIRSYLKETVKPLIPENVRNAIRDVTKYSNIFDTSGTKVLNSVTKDDVWIPSNQEIFGGTSYETLGHVYSDVFTDANSRKKFKVGASSASNWWLRSASSGYGFKCVFGSGNSDYDSARATYGVAPGFCL